MTTDPLAFARRLIALGVPVFTCRPDPTKDTGFSLPSGWERTIAREEALTNWRPGWGLAAVGGQGVDFIDVDPRNGGDASLFPMPTVLAMVATPGGGAHFYVKSLGVPKTKRDGVDLQAGGPDGKGRGFVFLPGTVRGDNSKGKPQGPYVLAADNLDAWSAGDTSGEAFLSWVGAAKAPAPATDPDNVWDTFEGPHETDPLLVTGNPIPQGIHQETLFKTACRLRALGTPEDVAAATIRYRAEHDCRPPWAGPQDAWAAVAHAYERYEPGEARVEGKPEPALEAPEGARTRLRVLRADELHTLERPTPLIEGILDVQTLALLSGKFGTYKTFVALAWAASLATGTPWGSHSVPKARKVTYVAAEGASGIRDRLAAWSEGTGIEVPGDMFDIIPMGVRLGDPQHVADLIEVGRGSGLIVLDTLHRMTPGMEEQSAKDVGLTIGALDQIRDATGATILPLHHTGHSGVRSRGSSALEDDIDHSWVIQLAGDGEDRGPDVLRTLVHRKIKDGELQPDREIVLNIAGYSAWASPGAVQNSLTKKARALAKIWAVLEAADVLIDPTDENGKPLSQKILADKARDLGASGDGNGDLAAVVKTLWAVHRNAFPPDRPEWAPAPNLGAWATDARASAA